MKKIFWLIAVMLVLTSQIFAQGSIFTGKVTIVKEERYDSPWSESRVETLYVDTAGNDTSSAWPFYTWFWPVTGWAYGLSAESLSAKSPPDSLFVQWRYLYVTGGTWSSWATLETITPPYKAIPRAESYKAVTIPTVKPYEIQNRVIAKDADSCDVKWRIRWFAW